MGFVSTRTSEDIQLPTQIDIPSSQDAQKIYDKIQEVIESGKLLDLVDVFGLIYKG